MKCSSFDSVAVCFFNFIQIQNLRQTEENVCLKSLLQWETAELDAAVSWRCSVTLNGIEAIYLTFVILNTNLALL